MNRKKDIYRAPKKYVCIVKADAARWVKYHTSNLVNFCTFLDKMYSGWRFFNVYKNTAPERGTKLGSFTKYRRPIEPRPF